MIPSFSSLHPFLILVSFLFHPHFCLILVDPSSPVHSLLPSIQVEKDDSSLNLPVGEEDSRMKEPMSQLKEREEEERFLESPFSSCSSSSGKIFLSLPQVRFPQVRFPQVRFPQVRFILQSTDFSSPKKFPRLLPNLSLLSTCSPDGSSPSLLPSRVRIYGCVSNSTLSNSTDRRSNSTFSNSRDRRSNSTETDRICGMERSQKRRSRFEVDFVAPFESRSLWTDVRAKMVTRKEGSSTTRRPLSSSSWFSSIGASSSVATSIRSNLLVPIPSSVIEKDACSKHGINCPVLAGKKYTYFHDFDPFKTSGDTSWSSPLLSSLNNLLVTKEEARMEIVWKFTDYWGYPLTCFKLQINLV